MPYDPALTAIAVATNDALTEHLWRYDTGDTDSGDPIAHVAIELARQSHDFNTTAGSGPHRRLTTRLRDAQSLLAGRSLPTFPSLFPMLRIDHVFVGDAVEVLNVEAPATPLSRTASDHLPLVVDFRLKAAPPAA